MFAMNGIVVFVACSAFSTNYVIGNILTNNVTANIPTNNVTSNILDVNPQCYLGIPVENFNAKEFEGTWNLNYVQPRYVFSVFVNCSDTLKLKEENTYSVSTVITLLNVGNLEIFEDKWFIKNNGTTLDLHFPGPIAPFSGEFRVLSTDYKSYTILRGCPKAIGYLNGTVLSFRKRCPDEATLNTRKAELKKLKLEFNDFGHDPLLSIECSNKSSVLNLK